MHHHALRLFGLTALFTLLLGCQSPVSPTPHSWQRALNAPLWTSPSVDGDSLFLGADDGHLYALDRRSGDTLWTFASGGKIRSQAAVDAAHVYFASDDGLLYALDKRDGSPRWQLRLHPANLPRHEPGTEAPYDYDYRSSSPVLSGERLFIGAANGDVLAVNTVTGQELWRVNAGERVRSTALVVGERIYIGSWDHHLYAFDAASGATLWRYDTGGPIQSRAAFGEGVILIGSRSAKLVALDATTGELRWEHKHEDGSWVESSAVYHAGTFYIGSSDALKVQALRAATGGVVWETKVGGWAWATPAIDGERIYIGTLSAAPYYMENITLRQGLHALDLRSGTALWEIQSQPVAAYVNGGFAEAVAITGGTIYAAGVDGVVYAVPSER